MGDSQDDTVVYYMQGVGLVTVVRKELLVGVQGMDCKLGFDTKVLDHVQI